MPLSDLDIRNKEKGTVESAGSAQRFDLIFAEPVAPSEGGYPGFNPRTEKMIIQYAGGYPTKNKAKEMIIQYDTPVSMRDGNRMYVDLYRPSQEGKYPVIIAWGPYGKHVSQLARGSVNNGLEDHVFNEYTKFEAPDPVYWCKNDYIIINVDPRGSWNSEGDLTLMSPQEVEDCYDLIEWAGTQSWSNGKVGMLGVSYLAWTQWKVAAANPPHLAAICPWEGVSDFYRELAFHGGIPETAFYPGWSSRSLRFSTTRVEDLAEMQKRHPLFDDYWVSKNADLSKITVPAFVVASWSDHGLHTRGTIEGFRKIASKKKWLLVHGRKKWWHFYQKENVEKQRQFFNMFLKCVNNHVKDWPRVTLEIREKYYVGNFRSEKHWPPTRTQYAKIFLNASDGGMSRSSFSKVTLVRYNVNDMTDKTQNVRFEFKFDDETELTGYMKLKLWVQAEGSDDMDLFVAIEKIDRAGYIVPFPFFGNHDDGPVALGWLRVSHRELDEARSTPWQPFHGHQREMKLKAGEITPVEIEIWPSSTLFKLGEKLRIVVQGSDIYSYHGELTDEHTFTVNKGNHIIYTGGKYDSHLLVPVIPTD